MLAMAMSVTKTPRTNCEMRSARFTLLWDPSALAGQRGSTIHPRRRRDPHLMACISAGRRLNSNTRLLIAGRDDDHCATARAAPCNATVPRPPPQRRRDQGGRELTRGLVDAPIAASRSGSRTASDDGRGAKTGWALRIKRLRVPSGSQRSPPGRASCTFPARHRDGETRRFHPLAPRRQREREHGVRREPVSSHILQSGHTFHQPQSPVLPGRAQPIHPALEATDV